MHRNFDPIDLFFIVLISIYFVVLFIFVGVFIIKFFVEKNNKNELIREEKNQKLIINHELIKQRKDGKINPRKKVLKNFF